MLRAFGVLWWWLLLGCGGFVGDAAPGVCEWGAVTRCSLSLSPRPDHNAAGCCVGGEKEEEEEGSIDGRSDSVLHKVERIREPAKTS